MNLADPWVLLFLPLILLLFYLLHKRNRVSSIKFSSKDLLENFRPTLRTRLSGKLGFLRVAVLVLLLLALSRPRVPIDEMHVEAEGIDIVLAIDVSSSMLAEDFTVAKVRQNRLAVVKKVVEDFIARRRSDRIGMVAFAARAYTVCPLTLDYEWLISNLERVEIGAIEDGTAVGSAISSSLNRLKDTESKAKVIILLTDGVSNAGKVMPLTAAEAAGALGVKIYTIGAGTEGLAPYPVQGFFGKTFYRNIKVEIDEKTLMEIAQMTDGRYFRATDTKSLTEIYRQIDKLEKTKVQEHGFQEYKELFSNVLIGALVLLLFEIVLSNTILRRLP